MSLPVKVDKSDLWLAWQLSTGAAGGKLQRDSTPQDLAMRGGCSRLGTGGRDIEIQSRFIHGSFNFQLLRTFLTWVDVGGCGWGRGWDWDHAGVKELFGGSRGL